MHSKLYDNLIVFELLLFFLPLQVISYKSLRQSYQTCPCAEITFVHDDGQRRQFCCTFELTAGDTTSRICVRTSVMEVKYIFGFLTAINAIPTNKRWLNVIKARLNQDDVGELWPLALVMGHLCRCPK